MDGYRTSPRARTFDDDELGGLAKVTDKALSHIVDGLAEKDAQTKTLIKSKALSTKFNIITGVGEGIGDYGLAEKLWSDPQTKALQGTALSSKFVKGVGEGNLDPTYYGQYTVQDAVYCGKLAKLWQDLANNPAADIFLRALASRMHRSYSEYAKQMCKAWHIKTEGNDYYGVWLGEQATQYVKMIEASVKEHPAYMLVAIYPCLKLWPFLATSLSRSQPLPKGCCNVYAFWINDNKQEGRSVKLVQWAINVYGWLQVLNHDRALQLFLKGMHCEIGFFNDADA